jgi:hypothetical protein
MRNQWEIEMSEIHKYMQIKQHSPSYNWWIKKEITMKTKKYCMISENEDIKQILWDAVKVLLIGKFIAVNIYIRKEDSWVLVTHACNPSYWGGRRIAVPSQLRQIVLQDPISKKPSQKRAGGVAQGEGLEFKPQYCKKQTKNKEEDLKSITQLST